MKKLFDPSQFTATQWNSSSDKAKFANHFVRFVQSGYNWNLFPKWFYRRLSTTFGHIAHYDQHGFYETWFRTPTNRRDFINHTLTIGGYGDPAYTYSDVEKALQQWVRDQKLLEKAEHLRLQEFELHERTEYNRLKAKFEGDSQ